MQVVWNALPILLTLGIPLAMTSIIAFRMGRRGPWVAVPWIAALFAVAAWWGLSSGFAFERSGVSLMSSLASGVGLVLFLNLVVLAIAGPAKPIARPQDEF